MRSGVFVLHALASLLALAGLATTAQAQEAPAPPPPAAAPAPPAAEPVPAPAAQPAPAAEPAPSETPPPIQPEPAPAAPEPLAPPARAEPRPLPPTERCHDGLYLRLSLGLGPTRMTGRIAGFEYEERGGSLAVDVMVGGTPAPGLAVGGALLVNAVGESEIESGGVTSTADVGRSFGLLGGFIDGFFDPAGGFHLGGALGLATTSRSDDEGDDVEGGLGAVLMFGYDAWIADQWALGGLLRLGVAAMQDHSDLERESTAGHISLLFTALHH